MAALVTMSRGGECDTHHTVTETRVTPRLSRGGGGWQCSVTTGSGVVRVRWKWYTISFVAKSSSSRVQQSYLTHTSLRKFLPRCVHSAGAGAGLRAPLYCLPMDDTFSAAAAAGPQLLTMCWLQVAATFSAQKLLHAEQRSGVHNSLCWRALRSVRYHHYLQHNLPFKPICPGVRAGAGASLHTAVDGHGGYTGPAPA